MATILLVDADAESRDILRGVLTASYQHEVFTARNGEEALRLFDAKSPAIVLLNLVLPGISGLDLLARLKARKPDLPVLIVTNEVPTAIESQAREIGVTDVLRKGLKLDVIAQAVTRALHQAEHAEEARRRSAAPAHPGLDSRAPGRDGAILVVDDEPVICRLVRNFLDHLGFRVKTATSGAEALAIIRDDPPDLILLDIYMPGINGMDILRQIREANASIGVIMMTGSQDESLLQTALELGAFDIVSKPIDLRRLELMVLVKLLLLTPDAPARKP